MESMQVNDERVIRWLLAEGGKTLAVVGLSDKPDRPSYQVSAAMQHYGYNIVPVSPKGDAILGEPVCRSLQEIPFPVDVVQVFRAPEHIPAVWQEVQAMQHKPKILWLQQGIAHDGVMAEAQAQGIWAVQDRCTLIEIQRVRGR